MRPAKYLQTAVFAGCRIDGDKAGHQIRKRTPWTIISILTVWITPVQEVLVPQKAITSTETTAKRFFGIQMVVIKRFFRRVVIFVLYNQFSVVKAQTCRQWIGSCTSPSGFLHASFPY